MNELIMYIVINACKFDNSSIDKEQRISCAETAVNCIINNKTTVDDCINVAKKELK